MRDMSPKVLAVIDDPATREQTRALLESHAVVPRVFETHEEVLSALDGSIEGCVLIDLSKPGASAVDTMARLLAANVSLPMIIGVDKRDVRSVVCAMRQGATTCVERPFGAHLWPTIC